MKHVILVRHATAVKKAPSKSDFDRSLRKSGEKEARDMVKRTKDLVGKPALIITSPANRAVETAKVFAKGLGYPVKKIELHEALYEELAPETFLQFLKGLDDKVDSVMIFGHDPSFTEFARFLLPDFDEALPKCGVVVAGINTTAWAEIAPKHSKAEQFFYPGDRAATKTTEREIRKQLGARIETTLAETLSDFGIDGSTYVKDELHRASSKLAKRLASQANAAERAKGSKRQATDSKEKPA